MSTMSKATALFRKAPVPAPTPVAPLAGVPVRRIAATGVTAAATVVAMSAASAATSALRRRAERR
ncbi:hypothetical protein [Nocardioides sp.]|uniref:hypothetical protein n=1 Tax=Nocardioides sp. TaxID=35761 RepID=UPI0037842C03